VPVNPKTNAQEAVRATLGQMASYWQSLSQAIRDGWAGYASVTPWQNRFGDTVFLTGFQMFTRSLTFAQYCQIAAYNPSGPLNSGAGGVASLPNPNIEDLPSDGIVLHDSTSTAPNVIAIDGGNWIDTGGTSLVGGLGWAMYRSPSLPLSVNFFNGPWLPFLSGNASPAVDWPVDSPYALGGETILADTCMFVEFRFIDSTRRLTNRGRARLIAQNVV
jgi:hypothetical protein